MATLYFTRREKTPIGGYILAIAAVLASVAIASSLLIIWAHAPVGHSYLFLIKGAFGSRFAITETLTRATPLIFTGLAVAVAFRAGFYNIGAEGQFYLGALGAVVVGAGAVEASPWVLWPLMLFSGAAAGAVFVLGPAVAKTRFGVDEVVTTLLLNFVALLFVSALLDGPLKDPSAMGWPQSYPIIDGLRLPHLIARSRVHAGLLIGLILAVGFRLVMTHTLLGYEIKAVGANTAAARFAGIPAAIVIMKAALLSGALAGLGGVSEVAGRAGYLTLDMAVGYGYTGIVIAMLAQLDGIAVVFAAIAVAALTVGGDSMSRVVGVPTYMADVLVAVALLTVLPATLLLRFKIRFA